jgi:flavin reductase (DIM6/NTAB) family NADH-FMN oxidoreductase RutF
MDARRFREVLGSYPTGVTVVTGRTGDGAPFGLTVNSFTSVSLDPPLVLVCIDRLASSHDPLVEGGSFVVNVLAREQMALATRFASEPSAGRFDGVMWDEGPLGDPVLPDAVAWLACSLEAVHAAGDHSILVGRVEALEGSDRAALAYHRGSYAMVAP